MTRRRSSYDGEWADEVWRRYQRRRDLPRRQAMADLEESIKPMVEWLERILIRVDAWLRRVRR